MQRDTYLRMDENEANHWWFVARRKIIARVLDRIVAPQHRARILEAGCGTGGNLAMLSRYGKVSAFEYDDAARARAAAKSGLAVLPGHLPDGLPFPAQQFDLICLFDVLEHIEQDAAALEALASTLDRCGRIFVTVPAFPALWSPHDEAHHHYRRYTRKSLRKVARKAGLDVDDMFYFNTFLAPLAAATRLLKRMTGRTSSDDHMPPTRINAALEKIFASERHLLGKVQMPFGLSLGATLRIARSA